MEFNDSLRSGGRIFGDLTVDKDLTVKGAFNVGSATFDALTVDATNTETFLVRKDSDSGDVFRVDTSNDEIEIVNQGTGSDPLFSSNSSSQVLDFTGSFAIGSSPAQSGVLRLENNTSIFARNNGGGGDIEILGTDASDNVTIGSQANIGSVIMNNADLRMDNANFLQGKTTGSNNAQLIGVTASDVVLVGDVSGNGLNTQIEADGTTAIDVQTNGNVNLGNGNLRINADSNEIEFGAGQDSSIQFNGTDTLFEYDKQNAGSTSLDFQQNTSSVFTLNSSGNATVQNTLNINNSGTGSDPTLSSSNASQVLTLTGDLHASNLSLDGGTTTISSSEVNLLDGMSSKTGSDTNFVTGTSGTSGNVVEWDGNGDAVDSGTATSSLLQNVVEDTSPQLGGNLDVNGNLIEDTNGNELLDFTATSSAVNHFQIVNAATGNGADLQAVGGDTNIDLLLTPKGTGIVSSNANLSLDGGTTEISSSEINLLDGMTSKTGNDGNFVTGTAGSDTDLGQWDSNGDLVSVSIGDGLEEVSGSLKTEEHFVYTTGHTEWADALSNEEVDRIVLQSGETLVVDRIEFRQKGGGSSTSASVRVQDTTAATTIGSQDLGGTTKDPGSSGTANTVQVQVSNSTGGTINAAIRVIGRIQGA